MKDYTVQLAGHAKPVAVADMPTEEIEACLRAGVVVVIPGVTEEAALERLRLEQYIRANNLRDET